MLSVDDLRKVDDSAAVLGAASSLKTATAGVKKTADNVKTTWGGLAGVYQAPEQDSVLRAMDKPASLAATVASNGSTVAEALTTYGHALEGFKKRYDALKTEIEQLNAKITAAKAEAAKQPSSQAIVNPANGVVIMSQSPASFDLDKLYNQESDLLHRMLQFRSDVDTAERECANKIAPIAGLPTVSQVGSTSVTDPNVYGMTADDWEEAMRTGQVPFGRPDGWTNGGTLYTSGRILGRGWNGLKTGFGDFFSMLGFGDEGHTRYVRSGLAQFGGTFWTGMTATIGSDEFNKAWGTLGDAGYAFIGGPGFDNDPAGSASDFIFNVGGLLIPGGGWAKGGASLLLKGTKAGEVLSDTAKLFKASSIGAKLESVTFDGVTNPKIWNMNPLGKSGRGAHAEDLTFVLRQQQYPGLSRLVWNNPVIDFADSKANHVISVKSIDPDLVSYQKANPTKFEATLTKYAEALQNPKKPITATKPDGTPIPLTNPTKELNIVLPDTGLSKAQMDVLVNLEKKYPNLKITYTEVPR